MKEPHDPIRCRECGFEVEEANQMIAFLREELEVKEGNLRDVEIALRTERAKNTRMRNDRDAQKVMEPLKAEADEVFAYWQGILSPHAREFSGKRWDNVIARLRGGATVEELKRAIDGVALRPYVTDNGRRAEGTPAQRQVELELICRSESHVLRFQSYLEEEQMGETELIPPARVRVLQAACTRPSVLRRLSVLRGWAPTAVKELGLGLEGGQIIFFARDEEGKVTGFSRYQPNPEKRSNGRPKNIARGMRELFPGPEFFDSKVIWLVEGEPDEVAIRTIGFPGVAVPGIATWKEEWTQRFATFEKVYVCFDCDSQGREAAEFRAAALSEVTDPVVVDLDPNRSDGFDINDLLLQRGESAAADLSALATISAGPDAVFQPRLDNVRPFLAVTQALKNIGMTVKEINDSRATSNCPNHDDRRPSLSFAEGDDGRVLIHCHAGCPPESVAGALGLTLADLYPR